MSVVSRANSRSLAPLRRCKCVNVGFVGMPNLIDVLAFGCSPGRPLQRAVCAGHGMHSIHPGPNTQCKSDPSALGLVPGGPGGGLITPRPIPQPSVKKAVEEVGVEERRMDG